MKNPATFFASLTIAGALLISGCSADTTSDSTALGQSSTTAVAASSITGAVAELSYADLGISEADLSFDQADAVAVTLADGASSGGAGVSVDGDTVTLTAAGTYSISGSLSAGSLVINAPDAVVNLVLDGVDITAADVAAINVVDAEHVVVWLADGTLSTLADAEGAAVDDTIEDAPNATIFSTADLWIAGTGSLTVTANANDGITSKDSLVIAGGDLTVTAADDGVRGKDHLVVKDGTLLVDAAGDALKSDDESSIEDPDAAVGVIWIDGGTIDLTAGSDGTDAVRQVTITGGNFTIAAGDDGLHSDSVLRIDGGTIAITESVEGIEGAYMYLSGGDVTVVASDDGINVAGGLESLETTTTDAAATTDGTAPADQAAGLPADQMGDLPADQLGGPPMGDMSADQMGDRPARVAPGEMGPEGLSADDLANLPTDLPTDLPADQATGMQGGPGDQFTNTPAVDDITTLTVSAMVGSGFGGPAEGDNGTRFLEFSGGTYVIDTTSDGVDVNGSMTMTGGTLVVSSTTDAANGAMDVDDTFTVTGGTLAANGTSKMAVAPGETSTQASVSMTFSGTVPAGTLITIADSEGAQIASFTTVKDSQSFIFSSSEIESGADYTISVGGTVTGDSIGWLVLDGAATDGTAIGTVAAA